MSTFSVTAEPLTIHPHDNADALELAQVGLYRAVVAKGAYRTGDYAVYIPEAAVLPEPLIAELGLTGKLAGANHDRVKAVRLRGELSQGIVCRPSAVAGEDLEAHHRAGTDFADLLGITKYVPSIPTHMAGEMTAASDLIRWVEVENIRRYPDMFAPGEPVVATEKIHGTACLTTVTADGAVHVTSKGFGHQHLAIVESDSNLYWRAVRAHAVAEVAADLVAKFSASRVGIFGEVFGKGVQDLGYGADAGRVPGYAAFDIAVETPGDGLVWLAPAEVADLLDGRLPMVPTLYAGPYDEAALIALADGTTVLGDGTHIREGIVVRPAARRESASSRMIGKLVSPAYLTRKGGTEFE
ncbi:RNA ligase (ATP) [Polymorphospora sp. NPDC050346]|uniref:RNA ligase (ATP) n=1 Tax=Polymorphospora sp. NPDC050346 TaxID=3155780 RepID=UPI0033DA87AF